MYKLGNYFSVRTAVSPVFMKENYEDLDFIKRILLVSESLYRGLIQQGLNNKTKLSIDKYKIRSFSRATPLGAFASVSFNKLSNSESNIINIEEDVDLKIVPDGQWLFDVAKQLESESFRNLVYKWNTDYRLFDSKLISFWGDSKNPGITIHNLSRALEIIKNILSTRYLTYDDIESNFYTHYGKFDKKIYETFFLQLLEGEVLLSNLNSTMYYQDFDLLLAEMEKLPFVNSDLRNRLQDINYQISRIESLSSLSENALLMLLNDMSRINESEKYLKVDSVSNYSSFNLDYSQVNNLLSSSVDTLTFFCTRLNDNYLQKYLNIFVEKYGFETISFKKFWEENIDFFYSQNEIKKSEDLSREKIKEAVILNYFQNNHEYIDLKKIQTELKELPELVKKPNDFQLSVLLEKNEGRLHSQLSTVIGSNRVGKIDGRFAYIDNKKYKKMLSLNKNKCNEVMVSFIPNSKRHLNLLSKNNNNKINLYYHQYFEKNGITLDDLAITVRNDSFLFYDKKNSKEIEFVRDNVYNINYYPAELKFLIEASEVKYGNPFSILSLIDNIFQYFPILPRISIDNLTLMPQKWNMRYLIKEDIRNIEDFKNKLIFIQKKHKIPSLVFIEQDDMKLIVNLNEEQDIIYDLFKNKSFKPLYLSEITFSPEKLITKDYEGNSYLSEFVFNYYNDIKKDTNEITSFSIIEEREFNDVEEGNCEYLWFQTNLYVYKELEELFIGGSLLKFVRELIELNIIESFFFIRYKDTRNHIRARYKVKDEHQKKFLDRSKIFLDKCLKERMIMEFSYLKYSPEFNRYGGASKMVYVEEFFSQDSILVMNYLEDSRRFNNLNKLDFAVACIARILSSSKLNLHQQLEILNTSIKSNEFKKEFRKKEKFYIKLVNKKYFNDFEENLKLFKLRDQALNRYYERIINDENRTNSSTNIMLSLIHMFCIRIFGVNSKNEDIATAIVRHSLDRMYKIDLYNK